MNRLVLACTIAAIQERAMPDSNVMYMPILLAAIRAGVAEEAAWDAAFRLATGTTLDTAPDWFRNPIGRVFHLVAKESNVSMAIDMIHVLKMSSAPVSTDIKLEDPTVRALMTSTPEEDEPAQLMRDVESNVENTTVPSAAIFPHLIRLAETLPTDSEGRMACRKWLRQLVGDHKSSSSSAVPKGWWTASTLRPYESFLLLAEWIQRNQPPDVVLGIPHDQMRHYPFPIPQSSSLHPVRLSPPNPSIDVATRHRMLDEWVTQLDHIDKTMADQERAELEATRSRSRSPPRHHRLNRHPQSRRRHRSRSPPRPRQTAEDSKPEDFTITTPHHFVHPDRQAHVAHPAVEPDRRMDNSL
jgi:hypothetical protein